MVVREHLTGCRIPDDGAGEVEHVDLDLVVIVPLFAKGRMAGGERFLYHSEIWWFQGHTVKGEPGAYSSRQHAMLSASSMQSVPV